MALELSFCYTLSYDLIGFLAALWMDVKQLKRPKQDLCDSSVKQPLLSFGTALPSKHHRTCTARSMSFRGAAMSRSRNFL